MEPKSESVCEICGLKHGAEVPQLQDMQHCLLAATLRMRRMAQRLNLYSQLPQLYAHRFELEHTGQVENAGAILARETSAIAGQWERQSDVQLSVAPVRLAMQESYLVILCQELVENACKFSPAGTPISVSARIEKEHSVLEVINHGTGLRPMEMATLGAFKQFWEGQRKPAGLGLGLVLAQGIVRLHGGEIAVSSQPMASTSVRVLMPLE